MVKIQLNGKTWKVERRASIFTNRNGCEDVRVMVENDHGAKDSDDGKRYTTNMVLAAESGETIRHYEAVPKEIDMSFLADKGFLDKIPERN